MSKHNSGFYFEKMVASGGDTVNYVTTRKEKAKVFRIRVGNGRIFSCPEVPEGDWVPVNTKLKGGEI